MTETVERIKLGRIHSKVLDVPLEKQDWRDDAACIGTDFSVFFPVGEIDDIEDINRSKEYCKACSVVIPCLQDAVRNNQAHGTRGGMSEWERKRFRKHWLQQRDGDIDFPVENVVIRPVGAPKRKAS